MINIGPINEIELQENEARKKSADKTTDVRPISNLDAVPKSVE